MDSTNQHHWKKRRLFFLPFLFFGLLIVSGVVMLLWNWIIPTIFALTAITYWQAMGLIMLCRILFGGFRFHPHEKVHQHFNRVAFKDKFMDMTDEEKQQFKNQWKQRCC